MASNESESTPLLSDTAITKIEPSTNLKEFATSLKDKKKDAYELLIKNQTELKKMNAMAESQGDGTNVLNRYIEKYIESQNTIKSINGRTEKDFRFLSTEYDSAFRAIETIDSFTAALAVGTATTLVGAPIALPIACVCILSRCMTFIGGKYMKNRELSYICSACFGYTFNIMNNIKDMLEFYDVIDNDVKMLENKQKMTDLGILKNPATWNVVQANLYKFLFYLIEQIDFSLENLGTMQYTFFNALLSKMDFSRNGQSSALFKYSRPECAPEEKPSSSTANRSIIDWAKKQISKRMKPSTHMLLKAINHTDGLCTNYNDIIVRFLELKIKTLLENPKIQRKMNEFVSSKLETPDVIFFRKLVEIKEQIGPSTTIHRGGRKTKSRFLPSNRTTRKIPHFNEMQMGGGPFDKVGNFFKEIYTSTFKPVNQLYREMLREYVIMTGNFSLLISDYLVHYNKYTLEFDYKSKRQEYITKNVEKDKLLTDFLNKYNNTTIQN